MEVKLNIYDLSRGLARSMSRQILGKQIDGIWHTGIVVYGIEYYFGSGYGIEWTPEGNTPYGAPFRSVSLGITHIPKDVFEEFLRDLSNDRFHGHRYDLLENNCNNFTEEASLFLTGNSIPAEIRNLPSEALNSPMGALIRPWIEAMGLSSGAHSGSVHSIAETLETVRVSQPSTGTEATSKEAEPSKLQPQQLDTSAAQSPSPSHEIDTESGSGSSPATACTATLSLSTGNCDGIATKLRQRASEGDTTATQLLVMVDHVRAGNEGTPDPRCVQAAVDAVQSWPASAVFPVLDLCRLAVCGAYGPALASSTLLECALVKCPEQFSVTLMCLRYTANVLHDPALSRPNMTQILDLVSVGTVKFIENKAVVTALGVVLLNTSVRVHDGGLAVTTDQLKRAVVSCLIVAQGISDVSTAHNTWLAVANFLLVFRDMEVPDQEFLGRLHQAAQSGLELHSEDRVVKAIQRAKRLIPPTKA